MLARTRHRFTARFVETRWTVRRRGRSTTVDVLFPSWGRQARLVAVRRDGSRVVLGRRSVPLAGVAYLHVLSARSGYVIVPLQTARVTARARPVRGQSSAPHAGPTLALRLRRTGVAVRLAPATDAAEAAALAARLRSD